MKHISKSLFFVLFTSFFVSFTAAKTWKLDKAHTSVNFSINHLFSEVNGKFKTFDGTFNFDKEDLKNSSFTFSIDLKSVDTGEKDRDEHLMSEEFFHASKYPKITFESNKVEKTGKDSYQAKGKLTIRGVTKSVVVPFKVTGLVDSPWKEGVKIMGLKVEAKIDRTQFGVGTGSFAATTIVGDEVRISVPMELDSSK